jgi:hypothetical protein
LVENCEFTSHWLKISFSDKNMVEEDVIQYELKLNPVLCEMITQEDLQCFLELEKGWP